MVYQMLTKLFTITLDEIIYGITKNHNLYAHGKVCFHRNYHTIGEILMLCVIIEEFGAYK